MSKSSAAYSSAPDNPKCTCAAGDQAYLAAHSEKCAVTKFARRVTPLEVEGTRKLAVNILRDFVVPAPKQIQEAWEDVLTDRISEFVQERVSEQRNRADALEEAWNKLDMELRKTAAERDAHKNARFVPWSIVVAFTLSLFCVGFIIVLLVERYRR